MDNYNIGDVRGCRKLVDVFYDDKHKRKMAKTECIYCNSKKNKRYFRHYKKYKFLA